MFNLQLTWLRQTEEMTHSDCFEKLFVQCYPLPLHDTGIYLMDSATTGCSARRKKSKSPCLFREIHFSASTVIFNRLACGS